MGSIVTLAITQLVGNLSQKDITPGLMLSGESLTTPLFIIVYYHLSKMYNRFETLLCGEVMSLFFFSGGYFCHPCVGGFFSRSESTGNETAMYALIEMIRRASGPCPTGCSPGAVSTSWWMSRELLMLIEQHR